MRGRRWGRRAFSPALLSLVVLAACGSSIPDSASNVSPSPAVDVPRTDRECEGELVRLDELIAMRKAESEFPRDRLIEAQALRSAAAELCIDAQFDLALELIDEAAVLLGNS